MDDYKSTPSRLARLFEKGREAWKNKALERQKRLRAFDVKVRDLTKSRDKWKRETKELEKRVKQLEKEVKISAYSSNIWLTLPRKNLENGSHPFPLMF